MTWEHCVLGERRGQRWEESRCFPGGQGGERNEFRNYSLLCLGPRHVRERGEVSSQRKVCAAESATVYL